MNRNSTFWAFVVVSMLLDVSIGAGLGFALFGRATAVAGGMLMFFWDLTVLKMSGEAGFW
jgi:hypothetical protein